MYKRILAFLIVVAASTSTTTAIGANLKSEVNRNAHQSYIAAIPDDTTLASIANGHAYDKHVILKKEFPSITSKAQFSA